MFWQIYDDRYRKRHIGNRLVRRVQPILVSELVFVNDAHKNGCDSAHFSKRHPLHQGEPFLIDEMISSVH